MNWLYLKLILFWLGVFLILFSWGTREKVFLLKMIICTAFISAQIIKYINIWTMNPSFTQEIIGICIFITGIVLQISGRFSLGENWNLPGSSPIKIIQKGIYKYLRHPIYTGMILFLVGIELAAESWLFIPLGLLLTIIGYAIAGIEEKKSIKDPEYFEYRKKVRSMLIPGDWIIIDPIRRSFK